MDILKLNHELKDVQSKVLKCNREAIVLPEALNLGEIQGSYQNFYQQYLQYQATTKNGYYLNRMSFLERELSDIKKLNSQILQQQKIQQLEYANQEEEYKAYQKLYKSKVISRSEFVQQENKYLASKYPLQQSETAMLNNSGTYTAKEKELLDLRHTISEEQAKFVQALNQCITESNTWMMQHILVAPVAGKVSFAGIVQENQNVQSGQEVFVINPGNTDFFGEVQIPQYNMGKIKMGAYTLVKLHSYPYEQYGMIRGKLAYIADVAYRDSVFIAKVSFEHFENKDPDRKITLKNGMQADAEIITEESSLLQRFFRNITKMLNNK
ncbi:HlyD family secretion protein [Pedobacter sp. KACC 23697]|uniref:HlyD family efflux transporter periplasmic adaptor subunit n=1 Tax=Pedobacter sp. KACC 23697 TaxID=3149230 RepID=A0AAU7K726_9SPHI